MSTRGRAPIVTRLLFPTGRTAGERDSGNSFFILFFIFLSSKSLDKPVSAFSLPEVPAGSPSPSPGATVSSARPRHVKSMSASGHPMKSCLPPIDDNVEYQR